MCAFDQGSLVPVRGGSLVPSRDVTHRMFPEKHTPFDPALPPLIHTDTLYIDSDYIKCHVSVQTLGTSGTN